MQLSIGDSLFWLRPLPLASSSVNIDEQAQYLKQNPLSLCQTVFRRCRRSVDSLVPVTVERKPFISKSPNVTIERTGTAWANSPPGTTKDDRAKKHSHQTALQHG